MLIAGAVWVFSLIFLYEVRLKIIKAELNPRKVTISKILGLGPEKKYRLKDLQSFHTYTRRINRKSGFTTEVVEYNFIHLMCNDRIVGRISSQYHKNYNEMADFIEQHLTDLGYKKPGIASEIKSALRF